MNIFLQGVATRKSNLFDKSIVRIKPNIIQSNQFGTVEIINEEMIMVNELIFQWWKNFLNSYSQQNNFLKLNNSEENEYIMLCSEIINKTKNMINNEHDNSESNNHYHKQNECSKKINDGFHMENSK